MKWLPAWHTTSTTCSAYKVEIVKDSLSLVSQRWEDAAKSRGIDYSISTEFDPVPQVAGDETELREVFTNIFINAMDAMPGGGELRIHVGSSDGQVFAAVKDTGQGMTKEVQEKIFNPFFSTKGNAGNGLGMSVVYGIVSRHKGKIQVQSEVGKGSVITVILPADSNFSRQEATSTDAGPPSRQKARFLIIDDDDHIRSVLTRMLSSQGHEVLTASGARQGLRLFRDQLPDVVVTELGMTDSRGLDVASAVKSSDTKIPVILMTGGGTTLVEEEARKSGVDFIISKPFQFPEFERILNKILAPARIRKRSKWVG